MVDSGILWTGKQGPDAANAEAHIGSETTEPERFTAALAPFLAQLGVPAGMGVEKGKSSKSGTGVPRSE